MASVRSVAVWTASIRSVAELEGAMLDSIRLYGGILDRFMCKLCKFNVWRLHGAEIHCIMEEGGRCEGELF